MLELLEKTKDTNDLGYPRIDVSAITKPMSDFMIVAWQLCQENIKCGNVILKRPDTHRKMHYTGTVLACGPDVDEVIKPGDRIIFDQFSDFEKYWDDQYGRIAFLQESKQGSLFAIVPKRTEVEGSEPTYNFDV